jgi:hypothetical protein
MKFFLLIRNAVLKALIATVYMHFETEVVDDGGPEAMEQEDSFIAGPVGEKLVLRFKALDLVAR